MNCLSGLRPFSVALAFLVSGMPTLAADQSPLVPIARLWVAIKYFHPYIASRPIDWDKALTNALPAIRNAKSDAELSAGLTTLLMPLQDPLTTVVDPNAPVKIAEELPPQEQRTWIHHGLPSALPSAATFYQAFATRPRASTQVARISITPGLSVQIRLSEPAPSVNTAPAPQPDRDYADTPFPPVELRILSAFRIWGVIHNFFGYKDLMDEDWDAVFADSLPKFINAADASRYHLAVAEMISRLSDSNSTVTSAELDRFFGVATPPITIRLVEKKAVVTEILAASATTAGVQVGDVITAVDGQRIPERIKNQANYISASTAQALSAAVVTRLLGGAQGSSGELTIDRGDDAPRKVTLQRLKRTASTLGGEKPFRVLPSGIGYVDLTRLASSQVEDMYAALHSTRAIIFDARGPIAPLAGEIASCVATHPEVTTAIVTGPLSLEPDLPRLGLSTTTSSYFSMETIPGGCRNPYKGKTVMLIDERTIGNGEHLGLALETANNTEFLGTPSAGADSAVSEFTAPGGILIRFSGQDVRHSNGGPIQRMGLQPSLALAPKITAIRAHRDVVLEKAIEYLRPPATQASAEDRSIAVGSRIHSDL